MTIRGSHPSAVLVPVPAALGLAQVRRRVTGAGICGSASHEAAKAEGTKREKSPDEIGFIMARDSNQLVSAKAEDNFGSYLLCNTVFLDMFRTLLLARTS
jgi:hypothetical protein